VNADFDGTNWNREDTTQPAQGIEINNNKEVKYYRAAAGTNPITWTNVFTISTDRITASRAVIGTDPGGTEVLRAQNLRAGTTTITGNLTAPTAVIGTDPGGTEVLRAENLRAGGGIFSDIYSNTVVVGTDPGGTEFLRAESARLNAPVLLGSVPQFTMAAPPTDIMHVATKGYVDESAGGGFPRLINDVTLSSSVSAVTIDLAETVTSTTPLMIVGECSFIGGGGNTQVFMRVNNETGNNYASAWYGIGVTAGTESVANMARIVPRGDYHASFWLVWMPVTGTHRVMAGLWSTVTNISGGGVHPRWFGTAAPTRFTFLTDTGSFAAGTRFLIWRLGP
jgi:hypothetical protein